MRTKNIVLDLCGGTGSWGRPYVDNGYEVINVTLPEMDIMQTTFEYGLQFRGANKELVRHVNVYDVYGILAAPPCTMFSDARTNAKTPRDLEGAMMIVNKCLEVIQFVQFCIASDQSKISPLKFWALENPWYGKLRWFLGNPIFVFDPWEFGDMYKKRTALWGYFNLPQKSYTNEKNACSPKFSDFEKLSSLKLSELRGTRNLDYRKDKKSRQMLRSITPLGFAKAFYEANK